MTESARTALAVIADAFTPMPGRRILDLGCGPGALARSLCRMGARVTGVDQSPEAIVAARRTAPDAEFRSGDARHLVDADGTFDGAVFLNSLHHVPGRAGMSAALAEAARVTGPGRTVVVVEPMAEGGFFEAVRLIEDETAVRAEARAALADALERRVFRSVEDEILNRLEHFDTFDIFLERILAGDRSRAGVIATRRAEVERGFRAHARTGRKAPFTFDQPLRALTLEVL